MPLVAARVELFDELTTHLRAKVEVPAEAVDGVADEKYFCNLGDMIYRTNQAAMDEGAGNSR